MLYLPQYVYQWLLRPYDYLFNENRSFLIVTDLLSFGIPV